MTTTVKRITISLTKGQERQLKALSNLLGEGQSQVIHRGIDYLYRFYFPHGELAGSPIAATPDNPSQAP